MGSHDSIDDIMHGIRSRGTREPDAATAVAPTTAQESDELDFSQMEGCFSSLPANKTLTRLHVVLGDGTVETLQYHHLDVKQTFKSGGFVLVFAGTKFWEVRVKGFGPKLWRVYDLLTLHRMPYIREATPNDAKFAQKGDTMLTKIELIDVTPREREA